jgi:hypothetical protein
MDRSPTMEISTPMVMSAPEPLVLLQTSNSFRRPSARL